MPSLAPNDRRDQRAEVRRVKVADLLTSGMTLTAIAEECGVALATVQRDRDVILDRWRSENMANLDRELALDLRRVEEAIFAIWPQVIRGNPHFIDRLVKLLQRKARMLGYDRELNAALVIERETYVIDNSAVAGGGTDAEWIEGFARAVEESVPTTSSADCDDTEEPTARDRRRRS